jgi:gamma-glutamyl:cysteine ligase YbdK (ATP-grasp superfamily)
MPKWCSSTCRTRASERRRAAADGLAAVKVVERDIERIKTVTVVQHHTRQVEVEAVRWPSATSDWVAAISDLTRRVESGRVYDRDLESLAGAVNDLVGALVRRGPTR